MTDSQHPTGLSWFVIRAHYRQESRAEANLRAGGIETFLPWVRSQSRRRRNRQEREGEPLFPQYLFARFEPQLSLHDVTFTRGVQELLHVGGEFAMVDDEVIQFFRARVDEGGFIPLGRRLEPGERVMIECGPFAELTGIVERNLPARQRVIVLLTTVGLPLRVELPADHLRQFESAPSM
jgi:transcriptional antiterminator RfaH